MEWDRPGNSDFVRNEDKIYPISLTYLNGSKYINKPM